MDNCILCGYSDTLYHVSMCPECFNRLTGKPDTEGHHVLGREYPADVVTLPANLHRFITQQQSKWPASVKNPTDPLLVIAAILRAIGDFAAWVAKYAERLSDWLIALFHLLSEAMPDYATRLAPLWRN